MLTQRALQDTEFPGIVGRPMGNFRGKSDYHYQCLRVNVDLLKVIQIGISLFNEKGEMPNERPNPSAIEGGPGARRNAGQGQAPWSWQFNFKYSLKEEMYNQASIESLQQAGINFDLMERDGIEPSAFAALLTTSGLVCFEQAKWLSFHGGYDFGYLTKILSNNVLPKDELDFNIIMKKWFPTTYDVKHLMKYAVKLHNSGMLTPMDPGSAEIMQKFEQKSGLESIALHCSNLLRGRHLHAWGRNWHRHAAAIWVLHDCGKLKLLGSRAPYNGRRQFPISLVEGPIEAQGRC